MGDDVLPLLRQIFSETATGTRYPLPREQTKIAIMEKALALWPEIAPPEARKKRVPTIEDLYPILVEEGVGLRPHREDGIRIETQWVEANGIRAPVVFHYGCVIRYRSTQLNSDSCRHGSYGFESSWGSASMAVNLMEEVLATT